MNDRAENHDLNHPTGPRCSEHEPLLSAYALDELSPAERSTVTGHLAGCALCREALASIERTLELLKAPAAEERLEEVRRRLLLEAAARRTPGARGRIRAVLFGTAALAAAVLLVAFLPQWFLRDDAGRDDHGAEIASAPAAPAARPIMGPAGAPGMEETREWEAAEWKAAAPGGALAGAETPFSLEPADVKGREIASARPAPGEAKRATEELFEEAARSLGRAADERGNAAKLVEAAPEGDNGKGGIPKKSITLARNGLDAQGAPPTAGGAAGAADFFDSSNFVYGNADGVDRGGVETRRAGATPPEEFRLVSRSAQGGARAAGKPAPGPGGPEPRMPPPGERAAETPEAGRGLALGAEPAFRYERALTEKEKRGQVEERLELQSDRESRAQDKDLAKSEARGAGAALGESRDAGLAVKKEAETTSEGKPGQAPPGADPAALTAGAVSATAAPPPPVRSRVDDILSRLDRRPGETPDMMFFRYWGTNPFVEAAGDPLDTLAVDVDTASYSLFRSYIFKPKQLPPPEAIRTEEFINYFKSGYAPPSAESGRAIAVHAEIAPSVFAHEPDYKLLKIGIKARELTRETRKACSLVFVIDTSSSMRRENRLELVKEALVPLVGELDEGDTIGIVTFDREARVNLEPQPASEKERILDAIRALHPNQNTNVQAGLELGYKMASEHLLKDGVNRVLLLSDGVANTGVTTASAILESVRAHREQGIYLTCVGVGMGNLNDALLEQLADRGDGQCVYVDRMEEARKAFVENLTGTLEAVARDVKIQVAFDPAQVIRYRKLGYENRAIADADFRNNAVDAGEVGAGHEVTVLYELKLKPEATGKVAKVNVRYELVDHRGEHQEFAEEVGTGAVKGSFADASRRFQLTACVAEAAEVLRASYWARGSSLGDVAARLEPVAEALAQEKDSDDVVELLALLKAAEPLVRERERGLDDIARTVDALKENLLVEARIADASATPESADQRHLAELREETMRLRARLEEVLRR